MTYGQGAELLNFGAFIAFMGVNLAAIVHYAIRGKSKAPGALVVPLAGLLIDLFIWLNLSHSAQLLGVLWIAVGLALYFVMRRSGTGADTSELQFDSN